MTKLVIVVTHDQKLAEYFADRIINIENGEVVKDYKNETEHDLSILQEQIIYLKDYEKSELQSEGLNINKYHHKKTISSKFDIDLIERNDTLYVNVDSDSPIKLKFINKDTEIEIKDESSKNQEVKPMITVDPIQSELKTESKSAITFKDSFNYALKKINVLNVSGKLLYVILGFVGLIISVSVGMIGETYNVEQQASEQNRNYITVMTDQMLYEDVLAIEEIDGIEQVMFISKKMDFTIETEKYYEINASIELKALPVDIRFFDEELLLYGTMPEGYGIIIDKTLADQLISRYDIRGLGSYEDVLECRLKLQASGYDTDLPFDSALYFNITGIAEDNSESIWMAEELMYSLATSSLVDYQILGDKFEIVEGALPESFRDVMLHVESSFIYNDEIPYEIGITTGEYGISGTYKYTDEDKDFNLSRLIVTTAEFLKHEYYASKYLDGAAIVDLKAEQLTQNTAIAACSAIAGSTVIGKNCIIGGASGIAGHLMIADGVHVTAMTMVIKSLTEPGVYSSGTGVQTNAKWRKSIARLRQLDKMAGRIKQLELAVKARDVE